MNEFSKLTAFVSSEFDRYTIEHPDITSQIPKNALLIFQIEGEKSFNQWAKQISLRNRGKEQPVIYVQVKGFRISSILNEATIENIPIRIK